MANSTAHVAVHVANHELGSQADLARTSRFLRSRLRFFASQFPPSWQQPVHLDDRGQNVSPESREKMRATLPEVRGLLLGQLLVNPHWPSEFVDGGCYARRATMPPYRRYRPLRDRLVCLTR